MDPVAASISMQVTEDGPRGALKRRVPVRLVSAVLAGGIELALVLGLLFGLAGHSAMQASNAIAAITFSEPRPRPTPPPPPERHHKDAGKAAPAAKKAQAAPVFAPKLAIAKPLVPASPNPGREASASNGAALAGQASGAGGVGNGTGSGGDGDGAGDGGDDPEWVGGKIKDSDYPAEARAIRARGTTETEIRISADGRPIGCSVTRSSGYGVLDTTTCRLVLQRFRFNPARDADGRAIAGLVDYDQNWQPSGPN